MGFGRRDRRSKQLQEEGNGDPAGATSGDGGDQVAEQAIKTAGKRSRGSAPRAPACLRRHASPAALGFTAARSPAARHLLQPALKVGAANDPLEREAETMAERVVSMPAPQLAAPDARG